MSVRTPSHTGYILPLKGSVELVGRGLNIVTTIFSYFSPENAVFLENQLSHLCKNLQHYEQYRHF
jgi:hypothetical protein